MEQHKHGTGFPPVSSIDVVSLVYFACLFTPVFVIQQCSFTLWALTAPFGQSLLCLQKPTIAFEIRVCVFFEHFSRAKQSKVFIFRLEALATRASIQRASIPTEEWTLQEKAN